MHLSLLEIKRYMMQVRMASLSSMSIYFNLDHDLLRQMLGHWIRKGSIRQCLKTSACGSICTKCDIPAVEIYEWVV